MIQRIQTVYLALVAVFSILGLCMPIGQYYQGSQLAAWFNNFVFMPASIPEATQNLGPLPMAIVLIVVILITLMSIMLYRHRMRQLRLTIFTTILLVGYVAYYPILAWKYTMQLNAATTADIEYHLCIAAVLPVVSIILNCLAIHGIRRDEALVRSLDRLR